MSRRKPADPEPQALQTPVAEQLLIEELPGLEAGRILCTSLGRGQFASLAASYFPGSQVVCQIFDAFLASQTTEHLGAGEGRPIVECSADFPAGPFDLVAI